MKSPAAKAATAIRADLKKAFPKIKFQVKAQNYSGGDNVKIYWVDGPMPRSVEEVVEKYKLGHFDGQKESYDFSNRNPKIPQTYYIFTIREFSDFNIAGTRRAILKKYDLPNLETKMILKKFGMYPDQLLQKVLNSLDFPPREESMREIEKLNMDAQK